MPKKLSIEQIREYLKQNDVNCECELLSQEYKNSTTPLDLLCNKCGKTFQRDWAHLKRGRFACQNCANQKQVRSTVTIEDVRKFIEENDTNKDCILISQEYINSTTPLKLLCNVCGKEFERDFAHIRRRRFCCSRCGMVAGARKLIYTEKDVDEAISKFGYTRIGDYTNASEPFEVRCKRGHITTLRFTYFLQGHSGCKKCADIEHTGELSPNWKGGTSEVIDTLRKSINKWKHEVLSRDGYTCQITGSKKDLVVHHITSFNQLVCVASTKTGIPILRKISEYQQVEDFYRLQQALQDLHSLENGITLAKEVHDNFHKIYGKGNNNREQLEQFLLEYK